MLIPQELQLSRFDPVLNSLSRFTSRSKRFRPFDYACL